MPIAESVAVPPLPSRASSVASPSPLDRWGRFVEDGAAEGARWGIDAGFRFVLPIPRAMIASPYFPPPPCRSIMIAP